MTRTSLNDPVLALVEYWISAEHMHLLTHALREEVLAAKESEHWYEFRTYYSYWLSALFVVVEGFNELKLDKSKVPSLSDLRVERLRLFRNGCFHYQRALGSRSSSMSAR